MKYTPQNRGFIALISILIISTVLLATTLSLAQFGIANRFFILDLEQKAGSEKLAEACVHIARVRIYNDPAYEVNPSGEIMHIAGSECTIASATPYGKLSTIRVQATSSRSITNFEVDICNESGCDPSDASKEPGDFLRWEEVGSL